MQCTVRIPSTMRRLTNGQGAIRARGETVSQVLANLRQMYPDLGTRLFGPDGQFQNHLNIYVNSQDIRYLSVYDTRLGEGDIITLLPAFTRG